MQEAKAKELQQVTNQRTRGVIDWTDAFLSALEDTGVISKACVSANISRKTVWMKRRDDKQFQERFEDSLKSGALLLEAEAIRRASEGLIRKKFTKAGAPIIDPETGEQYVEHEYSDSLLLAMLRRHFPDQYRDKPAETHITTNVQNIVLFSEDKRKELQARITRLEAPRDATKPQLSDR